MTLRILIVDDEELARLRLLTLIQTCTQPACEVVDQASHAEAALDWIHQHPQQVDLVLLDIQMPGISGMELARQLRQISPDLAIIFVTAHSEHAIQAFELAALDYLTKPIKAARLQEALQRAAKLQYVPQAATVSVPTHQLTHLNVTERGRIVRVPITDILFLKAELKYVTLRTAEKSYLLDESLTELEQRLGPAFIRIHRNTLVAQHALRALEKRHDPTDGSEIWAVCVMPIQEWLAVSRRQITATREAMASHGLPSSL